jgi:hypothetical protein
MPAGDYSVIRVVTANARGLPVGESHGQCRWPDKLVTQARAMRQAGMSVTAIAQALGGPHRTTVGLWVRNKSRRPPARLVVKPLRPSSSAGRRADAAPQPAEGEQ